MNVKDHIRKNYILEQQIRETNMQTSTETVLLITIWTLTAVGLFFGTRTKLRKRRIEKEEARKSLEKIQNHL